MWRRAAALSGLVALGAGCHSAVVRQPPGVPPTPESITRDEPGGDADDPHVAALERLEKEPWGWRNDRQDALHVPMPDWKNWRRVKYFGVPTFVGFRYGDDHHAVLAAWVREVEPGQPTDPLSCLAAFEKWGDGTARSFGVKTDPPTTTTERWAHGDVAIRSLDAHVSTLLAHRDYAAAYAAYSMWPGTCTIFGVAVPIRDADDEARAVRDRYVREGFSRIVRMSEAKPKL